MIKKLSISLIVLVCLVLGCTRDMEVERVSECMEDGPITYIDNVKIIIDTKCSYSGCHDTAGSAPGNYTQYVGVKLSTDAGSFSTRVLNITDMPPNGLLQDKYLTDEEFQLLECWKSDGFLEQ